MQSKQEFGRKSLYFLYFFKIRSQNLVKISKKKKKLNNDGTSLST